MFTLMPLTMDRFLALVFPRKYKRLVTPRVSRAMVLVSWLPSAMIHLLIDPIRYAVGDLKVGSVEAKLINHYLSKICKIHFCTFKEK